MILGEKELLEGLEKLTLVNLNRAAGKAIKKVQAEAKRLCPVNHGELRDSIYTKTEWEGDTVCATCYTNKKYGPYVEFGTGPKGQENHAGISPNVTPVYVQHGWGIPEEAVSKKDAEKYGWELREYNGKNYYMTSGQAAHPFMYPALKNKEEDIIEVFADEVKRKT